MRKNNTINAFFALLRAGLWEKEVSLSKYGDLDYESILRLAEEQSVVGVVAAGLEHVKDVNPPQMFVLQLVGQTLQIEQRNKAMNSFIGEMVEVMREKGIYSLLVKGQGVAQCYERPQWRACGDVDFFLNNDNYEKAFDYLSSQASIVDKEESERKHISLTIDNWEVELHGTLRTGLWHSIDSAIDEIQNEVFCGGAVRSWFNGNTQIFLPRADEDVALIFSHILQHFYRGGIGLRQICDWCRLLWSFKESLNYDLLKSRIKKGGDE